MADNTPSLFDDPSVYYDLAEKIQQISAAEDQPAFLALADQNDQDFIFKAIDLATANICSDIGLAAESLATNPQGSDQNNRMGEIFQKVFTAPVSPPTDQLKTTLTPLFRQLRWLRENRINLGIPASLEHLQKIAQTVFDANTTYITIKATKDTAETMIQALPFVNFPDQKFEDDMRDVFKVAKNDDDIDYSSYFLRVSNHLFLTIVLCDSALFFASITGATAGKAVDWENTFKVAPFLITPAAAANDNLLQSIVPGEEKVGPDKQMIKSYIGGVDDQPSPPDNQSPPNNIGSQDAEEQAPALDIG